MQAGATWLDDVFLRHKTSIRAAILADPACDAVERVITRDMLYAATDIMIGNALRGPLKATLVR